MKWYDNLSLKRGMSSYPEKCAFIWNWPPCISVFSTSGDVQYVGGFQYIGGVQYIGGYHEYIGRIS